MKHLLFLLILSFPFMKAKAQTDPEKVRMIKEYLVVAEYDKQMKATMDTYKQMFVQQIKQIDSTISDSILQVFSDFAFTQAARIEKRVMEEDLIRLYDKYFTKEDIQAYIDFYKTPAGKKSLHVSPLVEKELADLIVSKYTQEMIDAFTKKAQELKIGQ